MEILLDTNFILTCVKQKIDFFSLANETIDDKIVWIIPFEVMEELKEISKRKGETEVDKLSAGIALEMVKVIAPQIVSIKNKNVDEGIRRYVEGKDIILATLDKGLRSKVKNKILTIKDVKQIEII